MHRNKRKREIVIISLIITLICMTVGYATYSSNVVLEGTSTITSSWDIRITDVSEGNKVGTAESAKAPEFNELSASLEANLYKQGDAMEYDITIENKGTLDAKLNDVLTNIEKENSEAVNITFSGYTKGEILKAGSIKTVNVKIEYNPNYVGEETSSETEITFDYIQNNNETSPEENTHLVKYDCTTNGGKDCSNNNEYLLKGEDIDLTKTAEKDGYDFIGWNTNKDAKEALTSLKVEDNDITLYAIFKSKDTTPPIIDNISTTSTTNSITAIVTAHDDESEIIKYEYSINNGNYIDNGNNNTYTFTSLKSDTSYKVKVRVTNEANLQAEKEIEGEGINLTNDVVTSGDGLYKDEYEEGRYIYKGKNVNNYITFNDEEAGWRIISIEPDKTIKIMKDESIGDEYWDNTGINDWTRPATLNTYLNGTYFTNMLNSIAQSQIVAKDWSIGGVSNTDTNLSNTINNENSQKWSGQVALPTASEYIRSNSDQSSCGNMNQVFNSTTCKNTTWMHNEKSWWTISSRSRSTDSVFQVISFGYLNAPNVLYDYGVRPTLYLSSELKLQGEGTKENPYQIIDSGISLPQLQTPTFIESGTNPKTVTITYPEGCGSTLTCTYQKDNGEEIEVTTKTQNVIFDNNGTLLAKVSDGTNTVSSSYEVTVGVDVTDNVTTSGDGLYKDQTEENRYIYKGQNPNNYVNFNNELWRIISVESDGTMKIVRNDLLANKAFDTSNSNNWARPATLNTYLNNEYYENLTEQAKNQIDSHDFGIGEVVWNNTNLITQITDEKDTIWSGKIGLISISDYIRSNTNNSECGTFSLINTNYSTCKNTTWLVSGKQYWTFSPASNGTSPRNVQASGQINSASANTVSNYRPALYIKSGVEIIGGEGTNSNPYELEDITKYIPTFKESGTNPKTVTITYPEGCGDTLTCSYKKDNEESVNVTSKTVNIQFTQSGSVVATASDGTNSVSSAYTVNVISGGDTILNNVSIVSSGDGLYAADEEGRYFYKGKNVNNYVTFNNETWRIISIEPDKTIKIMRWESIGNRAWDSSGNYGNNNWARPASLNTYLNGTYLSSMTSTAQSQIVAKDFSIGAVTWNDKSLSSSIADENSNKWNGKVALPTASEYIRSNSNQSSCGNMRQVYNSSTCDNTSWMHNNANWWTLSPDNNSSNTAFHMDSNGDFNHYAAVASTSYGVRPAVYISNKVQITGGDGSQNNPYTLG